MQDPAARHRLRLRAFLLICLSVFSIIWIITSLAKDEWIKYCFWTFGLTAAQSNDENISSNLKSISEVYDDFCRYSDDREAINLACDGFCDNLSRFKYAGISMIVFAVCGMLNQVVCCVFLLVKMFKFNLGMNLVRSSLLFSCLFFSIGLFFYLAITKPYEIKDPESPDADDASFKRGPHLALFTCLILYTQFFVSIIFLGRMDKIYMESHPMVQRLD